MSKKIHKTEVHIPPTTRRVILERHPEEKEVIRSTFPQYEPDTVRIKSRGFWVLPITTNVHGNLGTYLYLYDDGKIERVTVREDEGDEIVLIKPEDKLCKN